MKYVDECMKLVLAESQRLGFKPPGGFDVAIFAVMATEGWIDSTYFKLDPYEMWAHNVTLILHFSRDVKGENVSLVCEPELSWSSSGRSLAQAVAAIALYQRAVELAAIAQTALTGAISKPTP